MRRVLEQTIRYGVLEAFKLLVDVALIFEKHVRGRLVTVSAQTGG